MADDVGKDLGDVAARDDQLMMLAAGPAHHQALVRGLVVLGVGEAQRKCLEAVTGEAPRHRRDQRTVEAARQIAPDRHVGANHPKRDGLVERRAHHLHRLVQRALETIVAEGKLRLPEAALAHRAVAIDAHMAGGELADAGEHALRRDARPQREGLVEAAGIEGARDRRIGREDRLHLACEQQATAVLAQVERADAGPVAAEDQAPFGRHPQRQRPLALQALESGLAPGTPGLHDHFGVAARAEAMAERRQLGPQFDIVEDLAVEDDPRRAVDIGQRLPAAIPVDDRQAGMGKACPRIAIEPLLVRAAMNERPGHARQRGARRRWNRGAEGHDACHAAHRFTPWRPA